MKNQFSIETESKIALMVYGKTPCIQAKQKQFFGSKNRKKSYHLFEQLHQHTQAISEKSNIDCIWIYDHEVLGNTFGIRYSKAFESIFEQGYDFIISIGNDIPGLNESHIRIAALRAANHQAVLGPTQDGGDYLIAIHRDSFEPTSFANLPWNTSQLHDALYAHLKVADQEVFQLIELIDIDDFNSFSKSASQTTSGFFHKLFVRILQSIQEYTKSEDLFFNPTLIRQDHPLRAPPAFL
jgi:glycosyltransferase A (GT-A) superfamily protein (DUF2064 family)